MTELNRPDLLMQTALGKIISPEFADYLLTHGFYCSPASTKFHGNYTGGLFDHSFAVMNFLVELSAKNNLKWQRAESPFIVGMFRDLCKIDNYTPVLDADKVIVEWEYNSETIIKGHGDKSIILLSQFMTLTEEEVMCIRYHMGAFVEKDEWRDYTNAIHKDPNVLWTHHADMIASHVVGI